MRFENVVFEFSAGNSSQLPKLTLKEIAFSGRSNVGKSSLINKVVGRKSIARVSATPGKTGTINFYSIGDVRLVDLPGYGYAKVSFAEKKRWANLVEGYFNSRSGISLVIQLIDIRHSPSKDDMQMLEFLNYNNFDFIIALTKSDKISKTKCIERVEAIKKEIEGIKYIDMIPFSSVTGEGVEQIRNYIESSVSVD